MGSKLFFLLGLLMAIVLLISSAVAARDLAETSIDHNEKADKSRETHEIEDNLGGYGISGCNPGDPNRPCFHCGRGKPYRRCIPGRGNCRYGCCGPVYNRSGCRCCTYAGEAAATKPEAEPHN